MKKISTYSEKLKDQRWQKKRLKLLESSSWKCQNEACSNINENTQLQIHHKVYLKGLNPWDYEDWAYIVLCEECHRFYQERMEKGSIVLAQNQELLDCVYSLYDKKLIDVKKLSEGLAALTNSSPECFSEMVQPFQNYCIDSSGIFIGGMRFEKAFGQGSK